MPSRLASAIAASIALLTCSTLPADGVVTVRLRSSQANATLLPGATIDWRIEVEVSQGDNAGLALFLADLTQSPANPQVFDIPPAASVPPQMQNFDAPNGYANPGAGYVGVQVGDPGQRNLRQIGGAQNGFGQAGTTMGQSTNVVAGVGQPGPIIVADGAFPAPGVPGSYSILLENVVANTFVSVNTAPAVSPASPAAVLPVESMLTFTVDDTTPLRGDMNCDGIVDSRDVAPFSVALTDAASYPGMYPFCMISQADVNNDTSIDTNDISEFVACLLTGCP
ncbi:MAG TPA: hypothetical protein P5081_16860 [Phycisphaerae bacterium]|nr:hypothetical protein [Phycisphaerae bacterium]HRW54543.1 hypothetical protein [Phycisphaerae bacterium]